MSIRCQARILRSYKTKKAECVWPNYIGNSSDKFKLEDLPECGGTISLSITAEDEPDYHSDHYAELRIEATCDKCKFGYFPGIQHLKDSKFEKDGGALTRAVEFAVAEGFFERLAKRS